jgi:Isochorismatase family
MAKVTYEKEITALLVIDPYNDFISQGGKIWDHIRAVAEANDCVPHMLQVLNAARNAGLRVFYALHHRYRPGDYETWKYIAPIQKAAREHKIFEYGTWGGEIRSEFEPKPGDFARMSDLSQEQRRAWVSLLLETADEVGLPDDPEFRASLVGYLEWGSRLAVINSREERASADTGAPMPSWTWSSPGGPYRP